MRLPDEPSVLVLLVATDGAEWLPEVLRGLRAQTHRPMKVLAVDNASSDGSAKILAKAFGPKRVVTLERRVGYGRALAAALKVAADRGQEADAFLILHDDAALQPGAIEAMLEALGDDGVGIVGAKLLEWDDPSLLQDVGGLTDRYGRGIARVDKGEIDQGQHEGMHDVLYATSASLLVAREVVETVGLFDMRFVALRDDLDMCWRARLAGFRTVVTTAAAARHANATVRDLRESPVRGRVRYYGDRNMIATLIKNYGLPRLLVALPFTVAVSLLNAVLYLARGRRTSALQVLEALQWNAVHLPSTFRARVRAQHTRSRPDAEITPLMHHGATRLREQFERAVEIVVGEVDEGSDEQLDRPPPRLVDRMAAHPGGVALALVAVIGILGARALLSTGQVAGLEFAPFPAGSGGFFGEFASGWRGAGAGGAGPATPGFVLLGALTFLSFGSGWLAQRALLFGLPVVGAIGMLRLARALDLGSGARRVAVVTYAASPLLLGAFGAGRLPDLVLAAAAPLLVLPLVRAAGLAPEAGWRSTWSGIGGLAVASSLAPWSLAFVAGAGVVLAALVARAPKAAAVAVLRRAGTLIAGAFVLLLPWSVELLKPGSPIGGGGRDPSASMADLLALSPGAVRPIPVVVAFGIAAAALAGAAVAPERRRAVVAILGGLGLAGLFVAWAVARGVPWLAPRPALPLVAASIAASILVGIGVEAAARLGQRTFGPPHLVAIACGLAVVVQLGATAGWVAFGSRPGLVPSGTLLPSFLVDEARTEGSFRIAWIGGTIDQPVAALSGPGGETMRSYLARSGGAGDDALRRIVAGIVARATESAGPQLATLGVRYVVVRPEADPALLEAVARQVDLGFNRRFNGEVMFRNEAGLPVAATVTAPGWIKAASGDLGAVAAADSRPGVGRVLQPVAKGRYLDPSSRPPAKGSAELLVAEDFSSGWRARIGADEVAPKRSFGWATRFEATAPGQIEVSWAGQRWHRAAVLLQALLVLAFLIWRSQRAARERGER